MDELDQNNPEFKRQTIALLERVSKNIDEHKWHTTVIMPDEQDEFPTFWSYTTGLVELNHPEFVVFGLPPDSAHSLFGLLVNRIVTTGREFEDGEEIDDVANLPLRFRSAPSDDAHYPLAVGQRLYNRSEFPVLQLVLPDKNGVWPWEDGVDDKMRICQQLLVPEGL